MTLTKTDLQAIRAVVKEEVNGGENRLEKKIDALRVEINMLRTEMLEGFRKQSEYLSKAIADAVMLVANSHPTKEEFQELKDEVEDLKDRLRKLERLQKTS